MKLAWPDRAHMKEIADHVKEEKPKVAKVLNDGRYVDNVLESTVTQIIIII